MHSLTQLLTLQLIITTTESEERGRDRDRGKKAGKPIQNIITKQKSLFTSLRYVMLCICSYRIESLNIFKYPNIEYLDVADEVSHCPMMLVTMGQMPLLDLITHKDNNFRRRAPARIVIVIFSLSLLPCARSGRFHSSTACNRSREVLSEMSGTISDGPSYLNYTGGLV